MALGLDLYNHQKETLKFILKYKRCFVFDEIGLGKTISALETTELLFINKKIEYVLIIAPLSALRSTWAQHILRYYPHRSFTILHGPKNKRLDMLKLDKRYYIINPDGIKVIPDELISKKFDMIIIDESTVFASHKTDRTKIAWDLCKSVKSVVCMTGEPTPNDLLQSFSQAKLIHFNNPKYFTRFRDSIKTKLDMYTYIDKPEAISIVHKILQPAIRHEQKNCLDLPPLTSSFVDIPLTKEQKQMYKSMEKEYITWLRNGEAVTAANAAVKVIKLMQISAGLLINEEGIATSIDSNYRLKELQNIYNQLTRKKLVVFANFTESVNFLMRHFGDKARKVDGSVNVKTRSKIFQDFQEGDLEIIVGQPKAVSHSINLQISNTIVWWSPVFSNETFNQCNGRIRRAGQLRPQFIYKFMSTKIESYIYKMLDKKQRVSKSLLKFM